MIDETDLEDAEIDDLDVDEEPHPPHSMHGVVALLTGIVGAAIIEHIAEAYGLGAKRAGVDEPQPIELGDRAQFIEEQLRYLESSFGVDLLSRLQQAEDADAIDQVFADLEARADLYAGAAWTAYQAGYKDFGQADQLVDFDGPDDDESCEFCSDSAEGGPYPLGSAPEPGSGECLSNCRHELIPLEDGEVAA